MRVIGLDIHRSFAQIAILDGSVMKDHGRVAMERGSMLVFAKTLSKEDDVVLEATGNTAVTVRLLAPFVHRVVIANPLQVRAIAWAKVKTDKIDAAVLARLHAAGFLPEVWMPTEEVELQRRCIADAYPACVPDDQAEESNSVGTSRQPPYSPRAGAPVFQEGASPTGGSGAASQPQATGPASYG